MTHDTKLLLVLLAASTIIFGQQQPAPSLESVLANARQAQAAGDYTAAVNDYKQAVRLQSDMPQLWANLGLMQHEVGDIPGAIGSFQDALHLDPSLYVPNLFLGIDYAHSGKAKKAIPYLLAAEKLNKADPQAPLALGRVYISIGRFSAAVEQLDRATSLAPKLGAAWFASGISHLDLVQDDARIMSEHDKESPFASAVYAASLQKEGDSARLQHSTKVCSMPSSSLHVSVPSLALRSCATTSPQALKNSLQQSAPRIRNARWRS